MFRKYLQKLALDFRLLRNGEAILVFSAGKVGSSTINQSLKLCGVHGVHLHNFSGAEFAKLDPRLRCTTKLRLIRLSQLVRGRVLQLAVALAPRVRVITLVRDPMKRNISAMFQGLERHLYQASLLELQKGDQHLLTYIFENHILHDIAESWFQADLPQLTGIDLNNEPEACRDFIRQTKGKFELLALKLETLDQSVDEVGKFIGEPAFRLADSNTSVQKWYLPLYQDFQQSLTVSPEYLERIYNATYLKRFYSADELSEMKAKWVR